MDNRLQVRSSDYGSVKTKAIEDAKAMQALVLDSAKKSGRNPPKYVLMELIGKGSFGRVYKAYVNLPYPFGKTAITNFFAERI